MNRYDQNLYGFGEIIIPNNESGKWVKFEDAEKEIVNEVLEGERKARELQDDIDFLVVDRKKLETEIRKTEINYMIRGYIGAALMFFGGVALGHFFF